MSATETTKMDCATAIAITTADIARFTGDFEAMELTTAEVEAAWAQEQRHYHGDCPC